MNSLLTFTHKLSKSVSRQTLLQAGATGVVLAIAYSYFLKIKSERDNYKDLAKVHWLEIMKHNDDWDDFIYETTVKFAGKPWYFETPFIGRIINFNSPDAMEYHFKNGFEFFEKGKFFQEKLGPLLGHGIFVVDGDQWKVQRKAIANIFNVRDFRDFYTSVFIEKINVVGEILGRIADTGAEIDLHDLFHRLALDSFCLIAFGYNLKVLDDVESGQEFCTAFNTAQTILNRRFMAPLWWFSENIGSDGRRLNESIAILDKVVYQVIHDRRNNMDVEREDLLSRFMKIKDENGEPLDDKMLRDLVLNMLLAGRDTTAEALSWTIYLLSQNQHFLPRIREDAAMLSKEPTYEEVQNLKYIQATFLEGLRLHPSVPQDLKYCVKDTVFPDGTIVRKGDMISWSPYTMGRLKSLWGSDALQFNPARWINRDANGQIIIKQESPFKYPMFNAGPRICLGMNMAILEGKITLGMILRDFQFDVLETPPVVSERALTHLMKFGMSVKVKRIVDEPVRRL